ncbi:MAG: rod-binding protein [Campylobacterales bacterium]|nr:rod-binding protein [Campylobacterales bacterium]
MSYGIDSLSAKVQLAASQQNIPKIDTTADNKELREQTDAFESIIIKMLMDNALKDEKNLFSDQNDPGDKIYNSMYRDELSKASAGGFGFSEMLYNYLSEKNSKNS